MSEEEPGPETHEQVATVGIRGLLLHYLLEGTIHHVLGIAVAATALTLSAFGWEGPLGLLVLMAAIIYVAGLHQRVTARRIEAETGEPTI